MYQHTSRMKTGTLALLLLIGTSLAWGLPAAAQEGGGASGGGAILGGSGAPGSGVGVPGMFLVTPEMMGAINVVAAEEARMRRGGSRTALTPRLRRAMKIIMVEHMKMLRRRGQA